MRVSGGLCTALAAAVAAAGCAAHPERGAEGGGAPPGHLAAADENAPAGGDLALQMPVDIGTAYGLDPQPADVATTWQLQSLVYDTLVRIGPDFGIEPGLAESWETPDATTYLFHLRQDAAFSNGRRVTAGDAAGSLERLLAGEGVWRTQLGPVEEVRARDESTVEVRLSRPYAPFLAALANTPAAVLPMKELDEGSFDPAEEMLGSGPYKVAFHRQDVLWRFERNEEHWEAVGADRLQVMSAPQEQARMAALQSGGADLAMLGNVDAPLLLDGVRGLEVAPQATTDFYYLMLNANAPGGLFDDPRVRTALNAAIDRGQISEAGLAGLGEPTGVTPAGLPGACDPAALPSARTGLDEARALLAEAGAEDLEFTLAIYSTAPAPAVAEVIQQNLERIGVTAHIRQLDEGSWSAEVYGDVPADFDAALSWFAGYAAAPMVGQWWNPEAAGFNAGFMDPAPELDAAIETALRAEPGDREALDALCTAVDTDAQMIPLVTRPASIGYRSDAVSPEIYATEGYGNAFRNIAHYRVPDAGGADR